MKEHLREIYEDLASGKISRHDALERIKAIRRQEQDDAQGTLLFASVWREMPIDAGVPPVATAEHHVVTCGIAAGGPLLPGVSWTELPPVSGGGIAGAYGDAAAALLERTQELFHRRTHGRLLVQLVVANDGDDVLLAGLSGFLRTASIENPRFAGQVVLVPRDASLQVVAEWLRLESRGGGHAVVRYADGVRQVLGRQEVPIAHDAPPIAFRDGGVYLITGGLGKLGTLFVREILSRTRHGRIVVTGRRPTSTQWIAESERVRYRQVALGDAQQVAELVGSIVATEGRLDGIVHCAGMTADDFILRKTADELRRVLEPKVAGTVHLDRATEELELDFFVLFSSIAAVLGNSGQCDYAAANAFMDVFAARRNALVAAGRRSGRTRSIQWPLWDAGGMSLDAALLDQWRQSTGIRPMHTLSGIRAFHRCVALPLDDVLVVEGDVSRMRHTFLDARPAEAAQPQLPAGSFDAAALCARTEEFLRSEFSGILKLPAQKIDAESPLGQYGIDSIVAMRLTTQLEKTFGSLSRTLFFEYQTVRQLAGHLVEAHAARLAELFADAEPSAAASSSNDAVAPATGSLRRAGRRRADGPQTPPSTGPEPIAIIGMSGRYPQAVDLEAYWKNLRDGKDCVTEVPAGRWNWREYYTEDRTRPGSHYSKWGGFIEGVDEFDPLFFNISPKEARAIDPQERLFLQHVWMAVEDAGYTRASLQMPSDGGLPGQVGVYAGVMYNEYPLVGLEATLRGARVGVAGSVASIANRVSYFFNLHGPSLTIDTMCSSSLTAIHLACEDLRHRRTNLGIAGGVNVTIHPNKYLALSAGQFISSDGHCQSFGEGGDGYIPGEGVGVVVLKRLADAKRDGDHIHAVIRGTAINHGGRTNGYTVPNPQAQAAVIARALAESNTNSRHISYLEAHGTGTKLGDPIEIAALTKAFQESTRDTGFCLIGSAKSNIGHCESAAGIAGLTKVVLQLEHREIVPSLHSARLNPHIDFGKTPFTVNQTLRPWEAPVVEGRTLPRIAGISSFGAGGSNAHVVVEEHRELADPPVRIADALIVLSARTRPQLEQKARDLLAFVRARGESIDLPSMAYTLQVGREAMDERAAFVVTSIDDLLAKLGALVAGRRSEGVYEGRRADTVPESGEPSQSSLVHVAEAWVAGANVRWEALHDAASRRRMSLPAYPFARDRYWIDVPPAAADAPRVSVLHPLVHANTSDLHEQRYTTTFTGEEDLLVRRDGAALLPAIACLEMARAAVEHALPETRGAMQFRDVAWTQPVTVAAGTRLHVALFAADGATDFEIYSRDAEGEVLHCEGRAESTSGDATATLDARLLAGAVRVELPSATPGIVLHPALESILAGDTAAVSLASLRILGSCDGELRVATRESASAVDVDVCDDRGNVRLEIRGLRRLVSSEAVRPAAPVPVAREIALEPLAEPPAPVERFPRGAIALAAPAEPAVAAAAPPTRTTIRLADIGSDAPAAGGSAARLFDRGDGVFTIELAPDTSAAAFRRAVDRARVETPKALIVRGLAHVSSVDRELCVALATFPAPVVAVLDSDAAGAAFVTAAVCDLLVCCEDASFGLGDVEASASLATLLAVRFGDAHARDLLQGPRVRRGRELRENGWMMPIVPAGEIAATVDALAASLSTKSQRALALLEEHLSHDLAPAARSLDLHLLRGAPEADVRVVTLTSFDEAEMSAVAASTAPVVLTWGRDSVPPHAIARFREALEASQAPVVAALAAGANAAAWVAALLCDAVVYAREAAYSAAEAADASVAPLAAALFPLHFGATGRELLLAGGEWTGAELHRRAAPLHVAADAIAAAVAIAKRCRVRLRPAAALRELPDWREASGDAGPYPDRDAEVPLQSHAVRLIACRGGIAVIRMEEREAKNLFTPALLQGLEEAFAHIEASPAYKVVVLTGHDHYFASGGTKESLLAIQAGEAKFTDARALRLPFDCTLPVIAAMQGHGVGAGWSLGMLADVVFLSDESRYVSPYMDYGFTPGAAATWSLPSRLGRDLGYESLVTAQQVTGAGLRGRGLRLPVLPRAGVEHAAMELAAQIARMPRARLVALERQWTEAARPALEEALRRELAMHDATFVGQADTLRRIRETFAEQPAGEAAVAASGTTAPADALQEVRATLRTLLAAELQMQEGDIADGAQFIDLGLDSISGVSWIRRINQHYRTSIDATKVYSHPTLAELSRHVLAEARSAGAIPSADAARAVATIDDAVVPAAAKPALPAAVRTPRRARRDSRVTLVERRTSRPKAIAIVGMAGQFPQARNLDEYWRNLASGRDCISEVPANRWSLDQYYQPGNPVPGKTNSRWVGVLEDFDRFDPLFFNISPTEAESMDPQQRHFLQACWHGLEHAGHDASRLSGSKCGVYVGCATGEYQELSRRHRLSAQGFTGNATSILAARISYFLDLQGPCVSIDTACSSSLVAIAQACDSLDSGDIHLALAGGVYVMAGPEMHIRTAQAGMLSAQGRCFTFDQRADGFVPGEGVGVVVLKRLEDAERDGDTIYGVIEGWGVNQDGRTNGITAPNPESQTRLMLDVYEKFGIDPRGIQLVEAHGTGTKLGDPIEIEGLKAAFGRHTTERRFCALGSVKSNIGHALTAAGVAGVLKLVLALQHRQLPPTIQFERLNEHIALDETPFWVNSALGPWQTGGDARRAAVSSFGFSGTNAHLVIAEYAAGDALSEPGADSAAPQVIPLSARTAAQLDEKVRDLAAFLRERPAHATLSRVAFTLQTGREAMDERLAIVAASVDELTRILETLAARGESAGVRRGRVRRSRDGEVAVAAASGRPEALAEAWVQGGVVDWRALHGEPAPRRLALPLYPFARDRYWIDVSEPDEAAAVHILHPLLHANESDVAQTRFRSVFDGREPFIVDDGGHRILLPIACLEMARAAVEHSLPDRERTNLELREVVWGQPLVVDGETLVEIALRDTGKEELEFEIFTAAGGHETVHCRGRAVVLAAREPGERLPGTLFRLPALDSTDAYVLHPRLLDAATGRAASWLDGDAAVARVPFTVAAVRVLASCSADMTATVRGDATALDIDLCETGGKVCIEIRGLVLGVVNEDVGGVLAVPEWHTRDASDRGEAGIDRHVFLCELPDIETARIEAYLPQSDCIALASDAGRTIAERYRDDAVACFERIQTWTASSSREHAFVQIVVPDDGAGVMFAGLSGMLRTACLEHARLAGQVLLVPPSITTDELSARLAREHGDEPLVRITAEGRRQVLRWQELAAAEETPAAFHDDSVVLITGGLGGLGLLFAREILRSTQRSHVVITGRRPGGAETSDRLKALAPYTHRASYRQVSLENASSVQALVRSVLTEHGRLDGILHCAGRTADQFLARKTTAELEAVLAPKVVGTWNLDAATQDVPLDFFVLFSSIASSVGNPGQVDYAAANGFMDHFAAWRNGEVREGRRRGRTRAINWSLWQAGGIRVARATRELVQQTIGVQPMRTATGLQAFRQALALESDQLLVVEGRRDRLRAYLAKMRLFDPPAAGNAGASAPVTEPAIGLAELEHQVTDAVATVLRVDPSMIDADQPFAEFGLDSFLGAELIVAINWRYGTQLSHSRLFDYATVREFAAFLLQELGGRAPSAPEPVAPREAPEVRAASEALPVLERTIRAVRRRTSARRSADERIAIVGMSGRYPQASDLRQFWRNLAAGRNSITEVPPSRWDVERYYDPDRGAEGKTYSKWIGAVDDFDRFDPLFFRISPQEAEYMDPQHRLFLQESYRAFEDAGYSTATLSNRKCGVYLGITTSEYIAMLWKRGILSAPVTSNSYAIAAARIAYYLNLKGPAISVDTACSSSLVAVHLACQALVNGEIEMALAGGVTLWLMPDSYVAMSQAGMFSPDGQCKTFDDSANGIVNGEGVGAVVLRRLADAEAAGDQIYGVILGSGINQDGRTNGITAPSVNSQMELERSIYEKYDIDPESITYVEMHGTGTKLGDPIELEALSTVFREKTTRRNFCGIGSVKTNIGHTTAAAGVAGLQKVLLSMRHRMLVPTLHVGTENSRFDFQASPFYISREAAPWTVESGPRRAAVSSFGFSGTNAHLVVEEYTPAGGQAVAATPALVPLSARTPEQLRQRAVELAAYLRENDGLDLGSVAWTLQTGRDALEERLAIVARSLDELVAKLDAWLDGERPDDVHRARVEPGSDAVAVIARDDDMREAIERWMSRRKLGALADLWVRGLELDWSGLHDDPKPRRVSLPAYPFAAERCWVDAVEEPPRDVRSPLLRADVEAIEEIIDRIANDSIEPEHAVRTLRMLM